MSSTKWNIATKIFIINSFFLDKEILIKDKTIHLNSKSNFIINLTKNMNKVFSPSIFTENSILIQISKFKMQNFIKINATAGNYKNFIESPHIILTDQNKINQTLSILEKILHEEKLPDTNLPYNSNTSLNSNIEYLKEKYNLCEIEIYYTLLKQKDILLTNNTFTPMKKIPNHYHLISNNRLESLRDSISSAFNHNSIYNLLPFNDPTGTGKTHAVINNFVKNFPNIINKNISLGLFHN